MYVADQVDHVLQERNKVGRPSARKWRGSLLGGCVRAHWYSANGVPPSEPFTPETLRVFAMGNAVGDFLVDALTEAYGDAIRFEVPVISEENNFSGNIDALLRLEQKLVFLEFKSMKHGGFIRLKGAKPEHSTQVGSYAKFYKDDLPDLPREAWVIYVDKDDYNIQEFQVDPDEWGATAQRVLNVLNYYGDRMPPAFPDAARRKWPCGWCNWKTQCLSEGGTK
jgi:hypothetical protein